MHTPRLVTGLFVSLLAAAPARAAGTFTSAPITGDADSGINAAKTYTHAVDFAGGFGGVDPGTTINGVPFTVGRTSGSNYATTGFVDNLGGALIHPHSVPAGDNTLADLLNDFYFNGNAAGDGVETLTLTGLTPGTAYATTFYNMGFDLLRTRISTITTSDGGSTTFDQNFSGEGLPSILRYTFTATDPSITFTFTPLSGGSASFHQYGFTNEVLPEPAAMTLLLLGTATALLKRTRHRASCAKA
jgi:hypothetical protein